MVWTQNWKCCPYGHPLAHIIGGLNGSRRFSIIRWKTRFFSNSIACTLILLMGNNYHDRVGDIITKKRNRIGLAAGPSLILKSWLGLREVENWELKLDAEEELQVEEVDILFREHSSCTWFSCFFVYLHLLFSTQIYQIFRLRHLSYTFNHLISWID